MLKAYSNKIRTFSYYMSNSDVPRPFLGILLDFFLLVVIFFTALYLWLVYRTKSPILSLIICLVVTSLFGFAIYLRKRTSYKKNRSRKRKHIAREYMINSLSMLSRQEFEWQLIRALSSLKGLTDIEQRQGHIKAQYNNMPIAIGYHHAPPRGYESYERVWTFYNFIRSRGFNSLIYISSGYFEEACQNMPNEHLGASIYLLNIDDLLGLMEQAGMQPQEDLVDHLVQEDIKGNRRKQKYSISQASAPHKLKKYMISSLLFLGLSFIFRSYFLFYFVLSILFFVLGLLCQVLSKDEEDYNSKIPQ